MSTMGTKATGFTGQCGTCRKFFDDEAHDKIEQLTKDMEAAGWQVFPTCCAECIAELNVVRSVVQQKTAVPAGKAASKPTEKVTGDDTGRVRRHMRRRLL